MSAQQRGLPGYTLPYLDKRLHAIIRTANADTRSRLYTMSMTTKATDDEGSLPFLLIVNRAFGHLVTYKVDDSPDETPAETPAETTESASSADVVTSQADEEKNAMHFFSALTPGVHLSSKFGPQNLLPGGVILDQGKSRIVMLLDQLTHGIMTASVRHHYQVFYYAGDENTASGVVGLAFHPMLVDEQNKVFNVSSKVKDVRAMKKRLTLLADKLITGFDAELTKQRATNLGGDDDTPDAPAETATTESSADAEVSISTTSSAE